MNKIGGNVILNHLNEDEIAKILTDYAKKFDTAKKSADNKKIISAALKTVDTSKKVKFGDKIEAISLIDCQINIFYADIYKIYSVMRGKYVGEKFQYNGKIYKIKKVTRGNANDSNKL